LQQNNNWLYLLEDLAQREKVEKVEMHLKTEA
jgi:hypothetical protein